MTDCAHLLNNSGFGGVRNDAENRGLYLLCFHNSHKVVRLKPSYLSELDSSRKYCAESEDIQLGNRHGHLRQMLNF